MRLELTEEQRRVLLDLFVQATDDQDGPMLKREAEKVQGVKGTIEIKSDRLCPEMCFRFQEFGNCVHLHKLPGIKPTYTKQYEKIKEERKAKRIQEHKERESNIAGVWRCIPRDEWRTTPLSYGMYIWVDQDDKMIYYAKAVDIRRRHYTWAKLIQTDTRWVKTVKIWWIHTGWYEEMLRVIETVERDTVITRELLVALLQSVKPLELPEPPVS